MFEFIRFGDSFEHVSHTLEVLKAVKHILSANGMCQESKFDSNELQFLISYLYMDGYSYEEAIK